MQNTSSKILKQNNLTLEVLNKEHYEALTNIAKTKEIWQFAPAPYDQSEIFREKWLAKANREIDAGKRIVYVVFLDDKIVGSSSFYDIDEANKTANLGYTWFHPSVWGTKVNPTSKLLMLEYAFETLKLNRVGFCIHSLNKRSCRAVEKLGAKFEGVLRNHMILSDQSIRHTVVYSIIADEWLEVKRNLEKRINL